MADTLILVHPGSLPRDGRSAVYAEIEQHEGAFVVIDGYLSDGLDLLGYEKVLSAALTRAEECGHLALRVFGCDNACEPFEGWVGHWPAGYGGSLAFYDQQQAAAGIAHLLPAADIVLTGAWVDEATGDGCVLSVRDALRAALGDKIRMEISDSAAHVIDEFEDEFDDTSPLRVMGL